MGWVIYFIIYGVIGILVDNEKNSLIERLSTALVLLFWPLVVTTALVKVINKRDE